jgi:hypothetical protein
MTAKEFVKFEYDIVNNNYVICNEKYTCKLLNTNEYLNIDWKINNNAKSMSSKALNVTVNNDMHNSLLLIHSHSDLDDNSFSRYSISLFHNNTLISISNFKWK